MYRGFCFSCVVYISFHLLLSLIQSICLCILYLNLGSKIIQLGINHSANKSEHLNYDLFSPNKLAGHHDIHPWTNSNGRKASDTHQVKEN